MLESAKKANAQLPEPRIEYRRDASAKGQEAE